MEKLFDQLNSNCIQAEDDAELALDVLCSFSKKLKEYYRRENQNNESDVLMEIELKYSTVKALASMTENSAFVTSNELAQY